MFGSTPAIRLSPILVPIPYMHSSKRFCGNSGLMASRLPVDWKQSRHPVSMADSLSISSKPSTPHRRRISVFKRGRCLGSGRSEEHTSELQSHSDLVCRLLLEKKKSYTEQCGDMTVVMR